MKVILPYTKRIAKVTAALDASGYEYEAIDVSESQSKYFQVIQEIWNAGEGWVNVEHDIVVGPDTIKSFDQCSADWCIAPYNYAVMPGGFYAGLGCCKISSRLIARNYDAMDRVGQMRDNDHKQRHWCRVDGWLKQVLIENGEAPHAHESVQHLGSGWPAHGCHKAAKK